MFWAYLLEIKQLWNLKVNQALINFCNHFRADDNDANDFIPEEDLIEDTIMLRE